MGSKSEDNKVNFEQNDFSNNEIETEASTTANDDDSLYNLKEEKEIIPLMAEKLDVIKKELVDEAIITKEPIKETKTEQIPIMHEELVIEQRPFTNNSQSLSSDNTSLTEYKEIKPIETNTQIKIPLKREEIEIIKQPYVIEELLVKKKTVAKTETLSDQIIIEKVIEPEV
jgi:uncharacterized protein (TIGR02271 family)